MSDTRKASIVSMGTHIMLVVAALFILSFSFYRCREVVYYNHYGVGAAYSTVGTTSFGFPAWLESADHYLDPFSDKAILEQKKADENALGWHFFPQSLLLNIVWLTFVGGALYVLGRLAFRASGVPFRKYFPFYVWIIALVLLQTFPLLGLHRKLESWEVSWFSFSTFAIFASLILVGLYLSSYAHDAMIAVVVAIMYFWFDRINVLLDAQPLRSAVDFSNFSFALFFILRLASFFALFVFVPTLLKKWWRQKKSASGVKTNLAVS